MDTKEYTIRQPVSHLRKGKTKIFLESNENENTT
jgi:hypothetical protein